jgi:hypothetical protein
MTGRARSSAKLAIEPIPLTTRKPTATTPRAAVPAAATPAARAIVMDLLLAVPRLRRARAQGE